MSPRPVLQLAALAVLVAAAPDAHAAMAVYASPEALAERATLVVQGRVARRASLIWLSMALSVSRFVLLSVPETVCTSEDTIFCPP